MNYKDFLKIAKKKTISKFNEKIDEMELIKIDIPGNGFCFVSSVLITLREQGVETDYHQLSHEVLHELRINYKEFYKDFVTKKMTEPEFLNRCVDFLQSGNYSNEVADVCVGACANALGVNLLILERGAKHVTMSTHKVARGYNSDVYLYLLFYPGSRKKTSKNLDAHYNCYVGKGYYEANAEIIDKQIVGKYEHDVASDRLFAERLNAQLNKNRYPTRESNNERYVKLF